NVDFGYEFVDADWVLEFPEADAPSPAPWQRSGDSGGLVSRRSPPAGLAPPRIIGLRHNPETGDLSFEARNSAAGEGSWHVAGSAGSMAPGESGEKHATSTSASPPGATPLGGGPTGIHTSGPAGTGLGIAGESNPNAAARSYTG